MVCGLAAAVGVMLAITGPVASSAQAGSGFFCYQNQTWYSYAAYQDCWGGTGRYLSGVWMSQGPNMEWGCASYGTYYGDPFSTGRLYGCGNSEWMAGITLNSQSITRWPLNHNRAVPASHLGNYEWY
jgi:hypothetical protein